MAPRFEIQVPGLMLESGLPLSPHRREAAERAAALLFSTPVIDWVGNESSLGAVADGVGMAEQLRDATKQLFLALVNERLSYKHYRVLDRRTPEKINPVVRGTVQHFQRMFERLDRLQGVNVGNGEMFLVGVNKAIERQIDREMSAVLDRSPRKI
ncbi:MAG: hypothetical protein ACOYNL_01175 [Rickettsiales bacterium]